MESVNKSHIITNYELACVRLAALQIVVSDPSDLNAKAERQEIFQKTSDIVNFALHGLADTNKSLPKFRS